MTALSKVVKLTILSKRDTFLYYQHNDVDKIVLANSVPAAAARQKVLALFVFTGRIRCVGGQIQMLLNFDE